MQDLDKLAAEVYDYCCARRGDNMKKDVPGNPRNVGNGFDSLFEEAKNFYRNIARWHLEKVHGIKFATIEDVKKVSKEIMAQYSGVFQKLAE